MRPRLILVCVRRVCGALFAGAISLAMLTTVEAPSSVATAATFQQTVILRGEGAWSAHELKNRWHNDLSTAVTPIDSRYTSVGSYFGRQDFLTGGADYVVTGVPFSDEELAAAHRTRADIIQAPAVVASLAMLFQRPEPGVRSGFQTFGQIQGLNGHLCDPADRTTWPPGVQFGQQCFQWQIYTGAVKVPTANLAAMLFSYSTSTVDANGDPEEPLLGWNHPAILSAFGVPNLQNIDKGVGAAPVMRSDPDETMYYLQQWASRFAPTVWNGLKQEYPDGRWDPITENIARQASASRGQADQQADQLKWPETDPRTGAQPAGGVIAPVPASMIVEPRDTWSFNHAPKDFVELLPMQNAGGEWAAPTAESITKAAAAGGNTPLYAFDHNVPGAYPFEWIDNIYVPAHGLTAQKTEAVATMVRYIATAGQDAAAPAGEGRLPQSLAQQALISANAVVTSNCVGTDRKVVTSSDPGPMAPGLAAMKSIGPMLHCETVVPPPSTTTTTTTTTTFPSIGSTNTGSVTGAVNGTASIAGATGSSSASTSASRAAGTVSTGDNGGSASDSAKKAAARRLALITTTQLPITPSTTQGVDRLGAFVLGVLLYLLLRKPAARAWQRVMT